MSLRHEDRRTESALQKPSTGRLKPHRLRDTAWLRVCNLHGCLRLAPRPEFKSTDNSLAKRSALIAMIEFLLHQCQMNFARCRRRIVGVSKSHGVSKNITLMSFDNLIPEISPGVVSKETSTFCWIGCTGSNHASCHQKKTSLGEIEGCCSSVVAPVACERWKVE